MKNFGSILALLATSATVISARALPQGQGLARDARTYAGSLIETRDPKRGKNAQKGNGTEATVYVTATTSEKNAKTANTTAKASGKKAKAAKGAADLTEAATGKKAKAAKNATENATENASASGATKLSAATVSGLEAAGIPAKDVEALKKVLGLAARATVLETRKKNSTSTLDAEEKAGKKAAKAAKNAAKGCGSAAATTADLKAEAKSVDSATLAAIRARDFVLEARKGKNNANSTLTAEEKAATKAAKATKKAEKAAKACAGGAAADASATPKADAAVPTDATAVVAEEPAAEKSTAEKRGIIDRLSGALPSKMDALPDIENSSSLGLDE